MFRRVKWSLGKMEWTSIQCRGEGVAGEFRSLSSNAWRKEWQGHRKVDRKAIISNKSVRVSGQFHPCGPFQVHLLVFDWISPRYNNCMQIQIRKRNEKTFKFYMCAREMRGCIMIINLGNLLLKLRMCNGILSCLVKQEITTESLSDTEAISGTSALEVALKHLQLGWPYCCMSVMKNMLQKQKSFPTESCMWISRSEAGNYDHIQFMHLMLAIVMMISTLSSTSACSGSWSLETRKANHPWWRLLSCNFRSGTVGTK